MRVNPVAVAVQISTHRLLTQSTQETTTCLRRFVDQRRGCSRRGGPPGSSAAGVPNPHLPPPARAFRSPFLTDSGQPILPPTPPPSLVAPPYPGSIGLRRGRFACAAGPDRTRSRPIPTTTTANEDAGPGPASRSLKHTVGSPALAASPQLDRNEVAQRRGLDVFNGTGQRHFHLLLLLVYQCGQRVFEPFPVAQFV